MAQEQGSTEVTLQLSAETKEALANAAKKENRTLEQYLERLLSREALTQETPVYQQLKAELAQAENARM